MLPGNNNAHQRILITALASAATSGSAALTALSKGAWASTQQHELEQLVQTLKQQLQLARCEFDANPSLVHARYDLADHLADILAADPEEHETMLTGLIAELETPTELTPERATELARVFDETGNRIASQTHGTGETLWS